MEHIQKQLPPASLNACRLRGKEKNMQKNNRHSEGMSGQRSTHSQQAMQEQEGLQTNQGDEYGVIEERINQLSGLQIYDIFNEDEHYKQLMDNKQYFLETMKTFELRLLNIIASIILHTQKTLARQKILNNAVRIDFKDSVDIAYAILLKAQTQPNDQLKNVKKNMLLIYKNQSNQYQVFASFYGFCMKQWLTPVKFQMFLGYESIEQTMAKLKQQKQTENKRNQQKSTNLKQSQAIYIPSQPNLKASTLKDASLPKNIAQPTYAHPNNIKNNYSRSQYTQPAVQPITPSAKPAQRQAPGKVINNRSPQLPQQRRMRRSTVASPPTHSLVAPQQNIYGSQGYVAVRNMNAKVMGNANQPIYNGNSRFGKSQLNHSKVVTINENGPPGIKMQNLSNGKYSNNKNDQTLNQTEIRTKQNKQSAIPSNSQQRVPTQYSTQNKNQLNQHHIPQSHQQNSKNNTIKKQINQNTTAAIVEQKNAIINNPYLPTFIEQNRHQPANQQTIHNNITVSQVTTFNPNHTVLPTPHKETEAQALPQPNEPNQSDKANNNRKWTSQEQSTFCKFFNESQSSEECRRKLQQKYGSDARWKVVQQIDVKIKTLIAKVFHKFESLTTQNGNIKSFKKNKTLILNTQSQLSAPVRRSLFRNLALIYEAMLNVNESKKATISQKIVEVNAICKDYTSMI